jgi:hypothetical protein
MYLQLGTWRLELLTALANQKLPDTNDEKLFEISTAIHGNLQSELPFAPTSFPIHSSHPLQHWIGVCFIYLVSAAVHESLQLRCSPFFSTAPLLGILVVASEQF